MELLLIAELIFGDRKMKIKYDKCEVRKTICSAFCILLFIFAIIILEYKSKKIALLIVLMPAMLGILIKTVRLLVYLKINHNKIWMEINNKNIIYYSIDNQKVEIPISNITNIIFEEDAIRIYVNYNIKGRGIRNLFCYYLENLDNLYQIPNFGSKLETDAMVEKVKERVNIDCENENISDFASLCGNYTIIIVGILFFFLTQTLWQNNINANLMILFLFVVGEIIIHYLDKASLCSEKFSWGGFLRCIGCSLTTAQYILCAYQIQMIYSGNDVYFRSSYHSIVVVAIVYVICVILFLPQKGIGRKFIKKNLKR